ASKTFLSSLTNTAVISAGKMITVPAGAYYVRFAAASSAGAFQLELGSTATTYEAYKSSILSITGTVTASDRFTWDGITGKIDGSAVVTSGNLQAYQNGWVFVQNSDGTPVTVVPATEVTYNLLGDMRISAFANGSGSANTNKVDHAVFAEVGTTRTQGDNSSKLSTTAYVDSGLSGKMPMSNNTSGIVGYFTKISGTVGAAYSLPTGGTWEYFGFLVNSSTGAIFGPTGFFAGVSAGGTQVAAATSGYYPAGYIRRIA
ncbi:MAG TPA: hypothetical protein VHR42_04930, partial [Clostridia bacterium]|nr:hypothetical protein [Clostridia bacterium]